jgi:hypothetical protein
VAARGARAAGDDAGDRIRQCRIIRCAPCRRVPPADIQSVKDALNTSNQTVLQIFSLVDQIRSEYEKQLPNVNQQKMLLDDYTASLRLN